ncbi:hypothetical protein CBF34_04960 [Vagococcus penaei]|uniref:Uncharacterized protein n=1 Tax=Vagococcus penaei TaxID=633807 RepID=A0A1Q2D6J1_9ENTE|nr:oligosaccharide flippase family protein [Vagococcus penaei]AQP53960.1 hypothetical protein BW732_06830 [Vagococcus penaei]RSU02874.1 hypothetical protein CBF34_04960 [Vagococcus penaei]
MTNKQSTLEKSMLRGTLVLTVTSFIVKILSAVYRVPFQNLVGDEGFYVYQQVYPLYGIAMTLALTGLPVYLSKLIASSRTEADRQKVMTQFLLFMGIGSLGLFLIVQFGASLIAIKMGDTELTPVIKTVSYVFLLVPILSAYRGFYQGQMEMKPTAVSQLIEQGVRVVIILSAGFLYLRLSLTVYQVGNLATFGSVIGGLVALVILVAYGRQEKFTMNWSKAPFHFDWPFGRKLFVQGGALCLFSAYLILFQLIDSFTVLKALEESGFDSMAAKIAKGVYDRGQPLVQVGLVVAVSMTATFLPVLTKHYLEKGQDVYRETVASYLKISRVISSAAAVGLAMVLPFINQALFSDNAGQVTLEWFVLAIFFVSMIQSYQTIYQSQNKIRCQFISAMIGLGVKIIATPILTFHFGTIGSSISTLLGLGVCLGLFQLNFRRDSKKDSFRGHSLGKLLVSLLVMFCVLIGYRLLINQVIGTSRSLALLATFGGVLIGFISYLMCLLRFKVFTQEEWLLLPFGDKVVKRLKKR